MIPPLSMQLNSTGCTCGSNPKHNDEAKAMANIFLHTILCFLVHSMRRLTQCLSTCVYHSLCVCVQKPLQGDIVLRQGQYSLVNEAQNPQCGILSTLNWHTNTSLQDAGSQSKLKHSNHKNVQCMLESEIAPRVRHIFRPAGLHVRADVMIMIIRGEPERAPNI